MIGYETIKNSMLWAAYGDAFGFITELCTQQILKYRTNGSSHIVKLIPWKRKIGGQYGVSVNLPVGCYSDDTQLRLAVCRSINSFGKFDFETFSKIEIPVFLAYGLGVGRGTKSAGESLKKKSIQWNTNFFKNKFSQYINAGGNGAAMRIQPHVLSSPTDSVNDLILKIMRDSLITHGHPVGWVGAVFHGLSLHHCLIHGTCPTYDNWESIACRANKIGEVCSNDEQLKNIWLPTWENESGKTIEEGVGEAVSDLIADIYKIEPLIKGNTIESIDGAASAYHSVVKVINAKNPSVRGSGTKTALLATFVGCYFSKNPMKGIEVCGNCLGSDTDTIATMAGAILGASNKSEPPQKVMDQEYIEEQASRLYKISLGEKVPSFVYPDLLHWGIPKSQLDFVGNLENRLGICGLGEVKTSGKNIPQRKGKNRFIWQWAQTTFGQTLLIKHREELKLLKTHLVPKKKIYGTEAKEWGGLPGQIDKKREAVQGNTSMRRISTQVELPFMSKTLEEITDVVIRAGFNEAEIGRKLLEFAKSDDGLEKAIAFAAIIVKAKRARLKRR